jgi:hypothetical protein
MRCMACGEEMLLVQAVPEPNMAAGFEHHELWCPACKDEERRLVFVQRPEQDPLAPRATEVQDAATTAPLQPSIETQPQPDLPQAQVTSATAVPAKDETSYEKSSARIARRNVPAKVSSGPIATAFGRSVATHRERWNALCKRLGLQVSEGSGTEDRTG